MAITPSLKSNGAVVIDASVAVAFCAREAKRFQVVKRMLHSYGQQGYALYAPGIIAAETLYALCHKALAAPPALTAAKHTRAIRAFEQLLPLITPPPQGDFSLMKRADELRNGYGCSRTNDSLYIALAEALLAQYQMVEIVTFDQALPNQVAQNAPGIAVQLLKT